MRTVARVSSSLVTRVRSTTARRMTAAARAASAPAHTYVDTHCHLDMVLPRLELSFEDWRASLDATAHDDGATLDACITIGCSLKSLASTAELSQKQGVYSAFGIHPLSAPEWAGAGVPERIEALCADAKCVAVGETGLDYHRISEDVDVEAYKATQRASFVAQMKLATRLDLPLIVHTREAEEDTLELMRAHLPRDARVHVHCFTSSLTLAQALLASFPKLCIGFTGVVSFKNGSDVRAVVASVPLDRILLETDSPYMAPTPYRGQVCHPGMIPRIAEAIASTHGVPVSDVYRASRENTRSVYGI